MAKGDAVLRNVGLNFGKALAVLLALCVLFLVGMSVYHHTALALEAKELKPVGQRVEVDGHTMNVYTEGERRQAPTVVLLSGSGVCAPVYDYKPLYARLSGKYRVAVVEKFGYGYAEESGLPRDLATLVEENRKALAAAGEPGPYVLMPHSMSALEAIYWAQTYPQEVAAIVGLDMAVPESYVRAPVSQGRMAFLKAMTFFGLHRIPLFSPVSRQGLSDAEFRQNQLLGAKNSLDRDVYEECCRVEENARKAGELGVPDCPMLLFTTNLGDAGGAGGWVSAQDDFAAAAKDCRQIHLDCGHELHHERTEELADEILRFLAERF